jgi:hypothetical protein
VPSTVNATIEAIGLKDFNKKITAEDYAYGIKRFIESRSDELNFIKGSASFSSLTSDAKIGVEAVDDYTLKITLEKNEFEEYAPIDEIKNSSNREETLKGLMEQYPQIRQLLPQLRRASVVITTVK